MVLHVGIVMRESLHEKHVLYLHIIIYSEKELIFSRNCLKIVIITWANIQKNTSLSKHVNKHP